VHTRCLEHCAKAAALCAWRRAAARRRAASGQLRAGAAHHARAQLARRATSWLCAAEVRVRARVGVKVRVRFRVRLRVS